MDLTEHDFFCWYTTSQIGTILWKWFSNKTFLYSVADPGFHRRGTPPGQVHPPAGTPLGQVHPTPQAGTPHPGQVHPPQVHPPPGAVHAGRYRQQVGGTHPTGMHSCCWIKRNVQNVLYEMSLTETYASNMVYFYALLDKIIVMVPYSLTIILIITAHKLSLRR